MGAKSNLVLVDTSAWIDAFRGSTEWVAEALHKLLDEDRALTCGPVLFEIRRGIKPAERRRVMPLMDALHHLPFEELDWSEAGELDATLRKLGHTLPSVDVLIAHICLKHKVRLLTLDSHFRLVPGLEVEEAE